MIKGYTIAELIESEKKKYAEKIENFCKTSEGRKIKTDKLQIKDLIPSYNLVYYSNKEKTTDNKITEETDRYYVKYGLTFLK